MVLCGRNLMSKIQQFRIIGFLSHPKIFSDFVVFILPCLHFVILSRGQKILKLIKKCYNSLFPSFFNLIYYFTATFVCVSVCRKIWHLFRLNHKFQLTTEVWQPAKRHLSFLFFSYSEKAVLSSNKNLTEFWGNILKSDSYFL
jgi:hypothetical protein